MDDVEPRLVLTAAELKRFGEDAAGLVPVSRHALDELRRRSRVQIEQNWIDRFGKSYKLLIKNTLVELGLYLHNGMLVMCTSSLLMIDFDTEEKAVAVGLLARYTACVEAATGTALRFEVLETDGGIHAFLTSHKIDSKGDNMLGIMLQLQSDKMYAGFSLFRGFCARLNPKITAPPSNELKPAEGVRDAIVARQCYGSVCVLGSGSALPELTHLLDFQLATIAVIKDLYVKNYKAFLDSKSPVPSPDFLRLILKTFMELMVHYELLTPDTFVVDDVAARSRNMRTAGVSYFTKYDTILNASDLSACEKVSSQSIAIVKKHLLTNVKREDIVYMVAPSPTKLTADIAKSLPYKMVVGFDPDRCMAFLVLGDILTIDWDFTDTMGRWEVLALVRQFLANLKLFHNSEHAIQSTLRFRSTPLAFRMFETDNGIHAFCTSHAFPHGGADSTRIMMAMCCDPAYIAFTELRGYSLRLTPKVTFRKDGKYVLDPSPPMHQFVQRPLGLPDGTNVIAEHGAVENPGLVDVVNMVYFIQRELLTLPRLEQRLQERDERLLVEIGDIATSFYNQLLEKTILYPRHARAHIMALHADHDPLHCPFVTWPSKGALYVPMSIAAKHPCGCPLEDVSIQPSQHREFVKWHKARSLRSMPKW